MIKLKGTIRSKPTLEDIEGGKFSFFIFETVRTFYKGKERNKENTTYKCIAYHDRAEDLNMMLGINEKAWIGGYFKNDRKDESLTFVVSDYGKLTN